MTSLSYSVAATSSTLLPGPKPYVGKKLLRGLSDFESTAFFDSQSLRRLFRSSLETFSKCGYLGSGKPPVDTLVSGHDGLKTLLALCPRTRFSTSNQKTPSDPRREVRPWERDLGERVFIA